MSLPCSAASLQVGEPLAASAPTARTWLVVEQPGPWGRNALEDGRLAIGPDLAQRARGTQVTAILARRPDRTAVDKGRRFWIAHTAPGGVRMRTGVLDDARVLLELDFAALGAGELPALGERTDHWTLFVCTQSGRDACCAVHGRALFLALDEARPDDGRIWECSHLSGHRFAPTALSLPSGAVYGRLDLESALAVCAASARGDVVVGQLRGRSALAEPMQAADIQVRLAGGIAEADALDALLVIDGRAVPTASAPPGADALLVEIRHSDGRSWQVPVRREELSSSRPASCGAEPERAHFWHATGCRQVADWR